MSGAADRIFFVRGVSSAEIQATLRDIASERGPREASSGTCTLALVAADEAELRRKVGETARNWSGQSLALEDGVYFERHPYGPHSVAMLFPGQGSQRVGMLDGLAGALPGYASALEALDAAWRSSSGDSLANRIRTCDEAALTDTRLAQPAIGLVSLAAANALLSVGVRPTFTAGHSYGELPALAAAGVLDDATFLRLSRERGVLLAAAGERAPGAMLAVLASEGVARSLATGTSLALANSNGPEQMVLAGDVASITAAERRAVERGIRVVRLKTSCAFHSPAMGSALEPWRAVLEQATLRAASRARALSNVTARAYGDDAAAMRDQLARQVVEPVRWRDEVEELYALGARIFLEVGPGEALTGLTARILGERPHVALALDPGPRDPGSHVAHVLARLAAHGVAVDASSLTIDRPRPRDARSDASVFFDANRRAVELFFAQQEKIVALGAGMDRDGRSSLFERVVATNGRALADFFAAQQHGLGPRRDREEDTEHLLAAPGSPVLARTPAPRLAPSPASTPASAVAESIVDALAELTGFPVESIRPESELERDLGVDSVTMVEVYFKLLESYPALEAHAPKLRTCATVGQLARLATDLASPSAAASSAKAPPTTAAPEPPPSSRRLSSSVTSIQAATRSRSSRHLESAPASGDWSAAPSSEEVAREVMAVIAAASGRDASTIEPRADLETDLGLDAFTLEDVVDSILVKRPGLALAQRELLHARTLDAFTAVCVNFLGCSDPSKGRSVVSARVAPKGVQRFVRIAEPAAMPEGGLPRDVLVVAPFGPTLDTACDALRSHGRVVTPLGITDGGWRVSGAPAIGIDDEAELARRLATLAASGGAVLFLALVDRGAGSADANAWAKAIEHTAVALFVLAKAIGASGVAIASLGVVVSSNEPASAGARGVARSLAREWPGVCVRSLAVEPSFDAADAHRALAILGRGDSEHDLVLGPSGLQRLSLERRSASSTFEPNRLEASSLVLVLGGGDGITAEMTVALARRYRCRFAVVGRTPMPSAMPYPAARDELALRRAVLEDSPSGRAAGEALPARVRFALRQRALWQTRERVEAAGGTFIHVQADASSPAQLEAALASIRADHGPFHAFVHGAGITEDALVGDKSVDSFRRVVATKAQPAFTARALLKDDPLRLVFLFSSLSAHVGTAGQTDYVAGNEILHAIAEEWAAHASYPVRAILWSVWSEAGLASAGLKRQMARLGLDGIRNDEGVERFLEEVSGGNESWVLLSPASTLEFTARTSAAGTTALAEAAHG